LTNLHIKFDFDVDTKDINSNCIFCKATGLFKQVEEDFDLLSTTELILRGLAKARFRNTVKIVVDNKVLYNHPEKKSDLRKTIDDIGEFSYEISKGKNIEITAALKQIENCLAIIKINKIHSKKEHSVDKLNRYTLPMRIGRRKATYIGCLSLSISGIFLFIPGLIGIFPEYYLILILPVQAILIYSIILPLINIENTGKTADLLLITIAMGLPVFLFSIIFS